MVAAGIALSQYYSSLRNDNLEAGVALEVRPGADKTKRRVAVAISGQSALEICRRVILKYAPGSDYEIALVFVEHCSRRSAKNGESSSLISWAVQKTRARVFEVVLWLEKYLAFKVGIFTQMPSLTLTDLNVPVKEFNVACSGLGMVRYSQEDSAVLRGLEIDVLVHLNSARVIVDGSPLSAIEEVFIRRGDSSLIESIEALCFESVHDRRPTVEAEVFTNQNSRGEAHRVGKVSVPAKSLTTVTLEAFQAKASHLVHLALSGSDEPRGDASNSEPNTEVATPTAQASMWQLLVTLTSLTYRLLSRAFRSDPRWHVAYSFKSKWESFAEADLTVIPNPRGRFYADPFLLSHGGTNYCFVEDYGDNSRKGRITVLEVNPAGHRYLGTALEEDFHLSFPFVFKYGRHIYMCPESAGCGQIRLYRSVDFPLTWTLDHVLMDNVSAADTTIFRRNKKWWMLTNLSPEGGPNHQSELHLFSAPNLKTSDWHPHPMNPLVNDATRARNAGLLVTRENVFRAFQHFGFDAYGSGIGISRISKISDEDYSERIIREVRPWGTKLKGLHTISVSGDVLVADFLFRPRQRKSFSAWSQALGAPK